MNLFVTNKHKLYTSIIISKMRYLKTETKLTLQFMCTLSKPTEFIDVANKLGCK